MTFPEEQNYEQDTFTGGSEQTFQTKCCLIYVLLAHCVQWKLSSLTCAVRSYLFSQTSQAVRALFCALPLWELCQAHGAPVCRQSSRHSGTMRGTQYGYHYHNRVLQVRAKSVLAVLPPSLDSSPSSKPPSQPNGKTKKPTDIRFKMMIKPNKTRTSCLSCNVLEQNITVNTRTARGTPKLSPLSKYRFDVSFTSHSRHYSLPMANAIVLLMVDSRQPN